jgi:hypothetical protein
MLVYLGPDTGFCLIFKSTLDKDLLLPAFDEAQDKALIVRNRNWSKAEFQIVDYIVKNKTNLG